MKVVYHPNFIRQYKKFPINLKIEIKEKIKIFIENSTNPSLKTHKLHGKMKHLYSFSINYHWRIVFEIENDEAFFLEIGTHDMYK